MFDYRNGSFNPYHHQHQQQRARVGNFTVLELLLKRGSPEKRCSSTGAKFPVHCFRFSVTHNLTNVVYWPRFGQDFKGPLGKFLLGHPACIPPMGYEGMRMRIMCGAVAQDPNPNLSNLVSSSMIDL